LQECAEGLAWTELAKAEITKAEIGNGRIMAASSIAELM
jgi:hypothetical protein